MPRTSASRRTTSSASSTATCAGHPETTGIASFRPTGFSNTGSPGTTNALRVGRTYHITNNLTWVRGGHTMKSGIDMRFVNGAVTNPQTQPQGRFVFDRNYTSRAGASGTGYSFASFLLGYPTQIQRDIVDTYPETDRVLAGLFVQDDIRIGQKLSLQLGVRWDIMTPPIQPDNRQSNFNPTDGLIHVATDGNRGPDRKTHWDYVAPRIGVAYTPDKGRTALRAAFGISYFADNFGANGGTNERNYPFFQEVNLVSPTQFVPFRSVSDGLPTFATVPLQETLRPPTGFAVFYIPADFHEDTVKMWNAGIQRQLGWGTMADVNYVGTRGTNLFRSYNINVPAPGPGTVDPRRPYFSVAPNITTITLRQGDGESWYDALQTKIDKRFSHGIQGLIWYTFSRTEDNVVAGGAASAAGRAADARQQQGARHPASLRRERHLRAAVRRRPPLPERRGRGPASAGRLVDQRDHELSQRRSAQYPGRRLSPQHGHRKLGGCHLRCDRDAA